MKTIIGLALICLVHSKEILNYDTVDHQHVQYGDPGIAVKGEYKFNAQDGKEYSVEYEANDEGYKADAKSVPQTGMKSVSEDQPGPHRTLGSLLLNLGQFLNPFGDLNLPLVVVPGGIGLGGIGLGGPSIAVGQTPDNLIVPQPGVLLVQAAVAEGSSHYPDQSYKPDYHPPNNNKPYPVNKPPATYYPSNKPPSSQYPVYKPPYPSNKPSSVYPGYPHPPSHPPSYPPSHPPSYPPSHPPSYPPSHPPSYPPSHPPHYPYPTTHRPVYKPTTYKPIYTTHAPDYNTHHPEPAYKPDPSHEEGVRN